MFNRHLQLLNGVGGLEVNDEEEKKGRRIVNTLGPGDISESKNGWEACWKGSKGCGQ